MNNFYTENKINYAYTTKIVELGRVQIVTVEDYVKWVREWKALHAELVEAIHYFRALKNKAKIEKDEVTLNRAWLNKKMLGRYAKNMYDMRVDRKASLKAGQYKELETV